LKISQTYGILSQKLLTSSLSNLRLNEKRLLAVDIRHHELQKQSDVFEKILIKEIPIEAYDYFSSRWMLNYSMASFSLKMLMEKGENFLWSNAFDALNLVRSSILLFAKIILESHNKKFFFLKRKNFVHRESLLPLMTFHVQILKMMANAVAYSQKIKKPVPWVLCWNNKEENHNFPQMNNELDWAENVLKELEKEKASYSKEWLKLLKVGFEILK